MSKKQISVPLSNRQIIWGCIYLAVELLVLPSVLPLLLGWFFSEVTPAAVNFLYYFINFTAVCIIFGSFLKRNLGIACSHIFRTLLYVVLGLLGYWAANIVMSEVTFRLMPDFTNVNDDAISLISQDSLILIAIGTVLLVPTAEECLFRGLFFRGIYGKSRFAAYAVSSLCFCVVHVAGYIGSYDLPLLAMCFVQYLPAGLILAWSYEKSNTILTPIAVHTVINAIGIYMMR